jgi:peptide/nickel transport system ATP-binding protein
MRNNCEQNFSNPMHPYTQALLSSILTPAPGLGLPGPGALPASPLSGDRHDEP